MNIVLIDYNSGNLRSAQKAFSHVAETLSDTAHINVTACPEQVLMADYIVLPGVGAFGDCAEGVRTIAGMEEALNERVRRQGYPFLGICVGMQLMAETGSENQAADDAQPHKGLGWIAGDVCKLTPADTDLKIPHMGWNDMHLVTSHPVLSGLDERAVYFVHSYALSPQRATDVLATCDYGGKFCAVIGRDNMIGTQFHPEKSQKNGLSLIENFLKWRP